MAAKKTPEQICARMIEVGYVDIRVAKTGIEWGEPPSAPYDEECIRLKAWVRRNYKDFVAYLKTRAAS